MKHMTALELAQYLEDRAQRELVNAHNAAEQHHALMFRTREALYRELSAFVRERLAP